MTDNTRFFNVFPVFFREKTGGFRGARGRGRWVVGWKTAEMGTRAGSGRYRDGSRSGTMRGFTPGTAEKPHTEVGAFLDRIWRT